MTLLEPPVDVPYCQRIACNPANPLLESDQFGCHSQPGCYFDLELATLRRSIGYSVLSTVPICHFVIRNQKFQQLATDYTASKNASWSSIHTRCFINQNNASIMAPPIGCSMLTFMKYYGINIRMLGWTGITANECTLINGCYLEGEGCFYPGNPQSIEIAGQGDLFRRKIHFPTDVYGQAKCANFDVTYDHGANLEAYHRCKQLGCTVDSLVYIEESVQFDLMHLMVRSVAPHIQQRFWDLVHSGNISAHNWKSSLRKLSTCLGEQNQYNVQSNRPSDLGLLKVKLSLRPSWYLMYSIPGYTANQRRLPLCPYRNYNFGIVSLKGSFAACCETYTCYTPKRYIRTSYSGIANYWSAWSEYGACSVSCGGGIQSRKRRCVRFRGKQCNLTGERNNLKACNTHSCPIFSHWNLWASCSVTCGGGTQTRTRPCLPEGSTCQEDAQGGASQSRPCQTGNCATVSEWSEYSECNVHCGHGLATSTRTCSSQGAYGCPIVTRTRRCEVFCGVVHRENGPCLPYPSCTREIRKRCVYAHGPGHCSGMHNETERCYAGRLCFLCVFGNC
ncbi:uncharacterized protein LOC108949537 [Ciona intestinalis]